MLDDGENTEVEVEVTEEESTDEGEQLEAEGDAEEIEEETAETDDNGDDDNGAEEEAEAAALTVTIEGEEDSPDDQGVGIRKLREAHKDQKKRIKELEAKLQSQQPEPDDLGRSRVLRTLIMILTSLKLPFLTGVSASAPMRPRRKRLSKRGRRRASATTKSFSPMLRRRWRLGPGTLRRPKRPFWRG